jgi:hypothetical protein
MKVIFKIICKKFGGGSEMRKAFTIGFWGVIFLFASVLAYSQRIETINEKETCIVSSFADK